MFRKTRVVKSIDSFLSCPSNKEYEGEVFYPQQTEFDTNLKVCTSNNFVLHQTLPCALFIPKTTKDVSLILAFCSENAVKVSVRGGGHSEFCVRPGVAVIFMKHFTNIEVTEDKKSASFGTGCVLGEIGEKLAIDGLAAPVGTFWTVGCGLVLQGGIGHLTRFASVACENIIAAEIVTPDGKIKQVSEHENKDLFWAIKGAVNCFGVVTKICLNVYPIASVHCVPSSKLKTFNTAGELYDDIEEYAKVLSGCEKQVRALPNHQHCDIAILRKKEGDRVTLSTHFNICSLITKEDEKGVANPFSEEFTNEMGFKPSDVVVKPYLEFSTTKGSEQSSFGISSYIRTVWVDEIGVHYWKKMILQLLVAPNDMYLVSLQHTGGAVRNPSGSSAFNCRHFEFSAVIMAMWTLKETENMTEEEIDAKFRSWSDDVALSLNPIATGNYPADIDAFRRPESALAETTLTFGAAHMRKLSSLKKKIDPKGTVELHYPLS